MRLSKTQDVYLVAKFNDGTHSITQSTIKVTIGLWRIIMSKIKPRAKIQKEAELDEVIEIKTLIRHPMHSGRVKDVDGKTIPRLIINKFNAMFNGKVVFAVNLEPSISSNPYIYFSL